MDYKSHDLNVLSTQQILNQSHLEHRVCCLKRIPAQRQNIILKQLTAMCLLIVIKKNMISMHITRGVVFKKCFPTMVSAQVGVGYHLSGYTFKHISGLGKNVAQ